MQLSASKEQNNCMEFVFYSKENYSSLLQVGKAFLTRAKLKLDKVSFSPMCVGSIRTKQQHKKKQNTKTKATHCRMKFGREETKTQVYGKHRQVCPYSVSQ